MILFPRVTNESGAASVSPCVHSAVVPPTAGKLPPLLNAQTMKINHRPLFLTQNISDH